MHLPSCPPPQKRHRRQAPAPGLAAVNTLDCTIRSAPQHICPLPVGQICVTLPPKALAGGTAAPKALAGSAEPTAMGNRQCTFRPVRVPQNAAGGKPLLLGLPPLTCLIAPLEVHRSISAPCPWGRYASSPRRRHRLASLPPRRHWLAALGQPPWGTGNAPSVLSTSKKRRRRQAPAPGLAAVNTFDCTIRSAPQHICPLPVGQICVIPPPKALAGGTAAPKALPPRRCWLASLPFRIAG